MNTICVGQRAEGKTTLAQWLSFRHSRAVAMWDVRAMGDGVRVHSGEELERAIKDCAARIRSGEIQQCLICYVPDSGNIEEDFHQFCNVLFPPGFTKHNFSVIVDEAAQLQKPNSINPDLDRAVRQAPRDVLLVQTTHSLQDYHRASKDLMDDLYCFKMKGRSLDAAVEYMDGDEAMRDAIRSLPPHHLLYYSFARHCGPEFEIWDDPSLWYVPLEGNAQRQQSARPIVGEDISVRPRAENAYDGWVN